MMTPQSKIKIFASAIVSNSLIFLLIGIVAATGFFLVSESGKFLNSIYENSVWWGFVAAGLIEISATALVVYRPANIAVYLIRFFLIVSIFVSITGGAAMFAITPILEKDRLGKIDSIRIEALKAEIAGYNEDVKRLSKQPMNLAIVMRKKRESNQALQAAIEKAESNLNTGAIFASRQAKIALAILLRVVLQSSNWLLIGWLADIFRRRSDKKIIIQDHQEYVKSDSKLIEMAPRLTENASKIRNLIDSRGGSITRQKMLESRKLPGAAVYDSAISELLEKSMITYRNGGKKSDILYEAV